MKTLRPAYQAALDSGVTTLAYCVRIERTDGVVHRFTAHDQRLTMANGAVYYPDRGSADVTAIQHTSGLDADTFDLEGPLVTSGVARADIAAGLFDHAAVYLFRTLYDDPVEDDDPLGKGFWGRAELRDHRYVTEFRSLASLLEQRVGRSISPTCDADLGDARCQVRLDPPVWQASTAYTVRKAAQAESGSVVKPTTQNGAHFRCVTAGTSGSAEPAWDPTPGAQTADGTVVWEAIRALRLTGTVTAVTDPREFTASGLTQPDDWWGAGKVTWLTGANAGFSREVESFAGGVVTLWEAPPFPVAVDDTFIVEAGCRKRHEVNAQFQVVVSDCRDKFDNVQNLRAAPGIPGRRRISRVGGQ